MDLTDAWTALAGLGLLAALLSGAGPVYAQGAPDGQLLQNQSRATQAAFAATFGQACAAQEWVWQHSLAVAPDFIDGPAAADGQALSDQDDDVQLMFVALFGTQADAEWLAEHNAVVAHHVLLSTVGPIQCPAARSSRAQEVIGSVHLSDAVDSARDGDLDAAYGGFAAFKTIWRLARPDVTERSAPQAQTVQAAFDRVDALIGDPKAPVPSRSQYYPALQNLLAAVRAANTVLAGG